MKMHDDTSAIPVIDVGGAPTDRGVQYGRKARALIELSIENYRKGYADAGVDWANAKSIAHSLIGKLSEKGDPLVSEMHGIAEGAGVSVDDIFALNCRAEIIYGCNSKSSLIIDGCTSLVAMPETTASGRLLHCQTWDWRDECADTALVVRIDAGDAPAILTQTEAGILARCGLNSAGIALTGNFLQSDRDPKPGGIPVPMLRRRILEQQSYSEAIKLALQSPKTYSSNLMISSGAGEAVDLETVPGETFWIQPSDGLLVHANHFESAAARAKIIDKGLQLTPCSLHRRRRVEQALRKCIGRLDIEQIKAVLDDRFDSPHGVCATPSAGTNGERLSTVATILMDVSIGRMWVARRPYLKQEYAEYELPR